MDHHNLKRPLHGNKTKDSLVLTHRLKLLERRDNEVYRSVFEATPIPDSARAKQIESKKELQLVAGMENSEMTEGIYNTLNTIYNRITNQEGSYKEIEKMIKNKEETNKTLLSRGSLALKC